MRNEPAHIMAKMNSAPIRKRIAVFMRPVQWIELAVRDCLKNRNSRNQVRILKLLLCFGNFWSTAGSTIERGWRRLLSVQCGLDAAESGPACGDSVPGGK